MIVARSLAPALLIVGSVFFSSCGKDDPAPIVGNLRVVVSNASQFQGSMYALYTEGSWAGVRATSALRQGPIEADFTINDLNTGNYIFTLNGGNPKTVQVTAGRTVTVNYPF